MSVICAVILCITLPTVYIHYLKIPTVPVPPNSVKTAWVHVLGVTSVICVGCVLGSKWVPVLNASTVITEQKDARNCVTVARRNLPVRSVLINVHEYSVSNCFNKLLNIK